MADRTMTNLKGVAIQEVQMYEPAGQKTEMGVVSIMPYILAIIGAPITGYGMAADNPLQIIIGTIWLCTACIIMAI